MSLIKYIAIAALILFGLILALIGVLSVTHDTPVTSVIAEGDKDGPPSVEDPLFARSIELFTGTHIDPGNNVQLLLNGNGTYPQLWKDIAPAHRDGTDVLLAARRGRRYNGEVLDRPRAAQSAGTVAARCVRIPASQAG